MLEPLISVFPEHPQLPAPESQRLAVSLKRLAPPQQCVRLASFARDAPPAHVAHVAHVEASRYFVAADLLAPVLPLEYALLVLLQIDPLAVGGLSLVIGLLALARAQHEAHGVHHDGRHPHRAQGEPKARGLPVALR